jgi:hypothetical protein
MLRVIANTDSEDIREVSEGNKLSKLILHGTHTVRLIINPIRASYGLC